MIKSLQGLRTLAMLGIFLFHSGLLLKGSFPVTFFFILSGFVLYYSKNENIGRITFRKNIFWVKKRMSNMYPIHLITFFISMGARWQWIIQSSNKDLMINGLLNIFLLQSLTSNRQYSFNGLSWFLSTTFILYIVALPIIVAIKKHSKIKPQYMLIIVLLAKYLISIFNEFNNIGFNLYTSPFYRVFDFILGMLAAKWFINNEYNKKSNTVYEFIIFTACIGVYLLSFFIDTNTAYSAIFTIGIYIFAQQNGVISNILKSEALQKLASISFEFYMVHELILIVFRKVFINLQYHWLIKNIIIAIPSFIISILLAMVLNKYITKRKIHDIFNRPKKQIRNYVYKRGGHEDWN